MDSILIIFPKRDKEGVNLKKKKIYIFNVNHLYNQQKCKIHVFDSANFAPKFYSISFGHKEYLVL